MSRLALSLSVLRQQNRPEYSAAGPGDGDRAASPAAAVVDLPIAIQPVLSVSHDVASDPCCCVNDREHVGKLHFGGPQRGGCFPQLLSGVVIDASDRGEIVHDLGDP
jgi:hypothetical protein